jgi:S-DNA-T family DNA segregation ATPase FtsK/SpoIIIE
MASRAEPMAWRSSVRAGAARSWAMLTAIALLLATAALALSIASYAPGDPGLNTAAAGPARNWLGTPGAYAADALFTLFGVVAVLVLPLGLLLGARLWKGVPVAGWPRMARDVALGAVLMGAALAFVAPGSVLTLPAGYGGAPAMALAAGLRFLIGLVGDPVIELWSARVGGVVAGLAGIVLWGRGMTIDWRDRAARMARMARRENGDDVDAAMTRDIGPIDDETDAPAPRISEPRRVATPDPRPAPVIAERTPAPAAAKPRSEQTSLDLRDNFNLPPIDLLKPPPAGAKNPVDKAALERNARLLETVLDDFHVKGAIVGVRPGPVVTMYELEPASGIKASRVIQLADDIARNMSAISARVATIPGRTVIGIELPNARREPVSLRELIASEPFADQAAQLPIVLGKDIAGDPVIADLAPMPHLLVAGTTGSGKSVGLNSMILSLLYRLTPDQCRLIMIDPKMLELSMYKGIPHLLADVVTDPPKAVRALKWAVEQMEDRYRMMASINVRSLASFNDKVRAARAKGQKLGRKVQVGYNDAGKPIYEEETLDLAPLPQIVVIVDELADLMMTAGKEVEFLIQRLAQKARAAGIHLIMATQRPSVDVITGVIKANLPTRISFHVTSKIDSRTILGEQGAEQLLGKGDMLYMPYGKKISRVHGPFVSDEEVQAVADFWRAQGEPDYIDAVTNEPEEGGGFSLDGAPVGGDSPEDQMYRNATALVAQSQKASTSWLQRQLRVGYNSAARLIERMEREGLVSKPDHVGRREVLMDEEGRPLG